MIPIFWVKLILMDYYYLLMHRLFPFFLGERVNEFNLRLILLQESSTGTRSEGFSLCLAKLPSLGRFGWDISLICQSTLTKHGGFFDQGL